MDQCRFYTTKITDMPPDITSSINESTNCMQAFFLEGAIKVLVTYVILQVFQSWYIMATFLDEHLVVSTDCIRSQKNIFRFGALLRVMWYIINVVELDRGCTVK